MKIIILILLSINCFSQTNGYVLMNADGTLKIPANSIPISKVTGLQDSLSAKTTDSASYSTKANRDKLKNSLQANINLKANASAITNVTNESKATMFTSPALTGNATFSGTFGFVAGAGTGGAITQTGNRSTGVTLNKISGAITTVTTSLAAGAEASFTVNNSTVAIGDVVLVSARSGQTAATSIPFVTAVANGSFQITLSNFNATTADTGAMVINFIVIKAVSN